MKKTLIILITVSIFSCSKKKVKKIDYIKHQISFLNREINIPKNYIPISFEDYKNVIEESYNDTTFINSKIKKIEKMRAKFADYSMFFDKDNIENTFIIVFIFNPNINEFIKNEFANFIVKDLKSKSEKEGFVYQNMENKLIDNWLIKIKGRKRYKNSKNHTYITQYMASNFGAFVTINKKDFDFEKELTE